MYFLHKISAKFGKYTFYIGFEKHIECVGTNLMEMMGSSDNMYPIQVLLHQPSLILFGMLRVGGAYGGGKEHMGILGDSVLLCTENY